MHIRSLILIIIIILLFISDRHSDAMTVRDIIVSPLFKNAKREAQNVILKKYNVTWKEVREAQKQDDIETRKRIYCTNSSPRVSFYFPGIPTPVKTTAMESYLYSDQINKNSYQFNYYKNSLPLSDNKLREKYIELIYSIRSEVTGSKTMDKTITNRNNKTIVTYVASSKFDNYNKMSYHMYVATEELMYNWSVHSYDGESKYDSKYLFDKYSNYVDITNRYCR